MSNQRSSLGKVTAYVLVRDENGKPKIDDVDNIPQGILNMLTTKEIEEIKNGSNT